MIKIKKVEFFGINGSGKSYNYQKLKNYLNIQKIDAYNRREIITSYANKFVKLSLSHKITLIYFKLIEKLKRFKKEQKINVSKTQISIPTKKNISILNFFRENYINICEKIYLENLKKKKSLRKIIQKILIIQNKEDRSLFKFWIYEIFAADYLVSMLEIKKNNFIYLNDEGFLQRSFLIMYSKSINFTYKKKLLKEYLKNIPKPDLCIYLFREKKVINSIIKKRKLIASKKKLNNIDIEKFIKFEKQIFKFSGKKNLFLKIKNKKSNFSNILKKII